MGLKKKKKDSVFASFGGVLGVGGTLLGVGVGLWAVLGPMFPGIIPNMGDVLMGSMSDVSGQFVSTEAEPLGAWTFTPDGCHSGERSGFHGVWLTSEAQEGHGVRIAKDANGSLVVGTQIPGTDQMSVFGSCEVSGDFHRSNTSVNDVWGIDGNVSIHCPNDGYSGSATFSGCF